jgi:hypothetical protein
MLARLTKTGGSASCDVRNLYFGGPVTAFGRRRIAGETNGDLMYCDPFDGWNP